MLVQGPVFNSTWDDDVDTKYLQGLLGFIDEAAGTNFAESRRFLDDHRWQVEEKKWGNEKCRCIGYDGVPGSTNVTINGEEMPYPADAGASCSAWDAKNHPDCKGDFGEGMA